MPSFEGDLAPPARPEAAAALRDLRASVEAHYRLYQGYVAKRNEILAALDGRRPRARPTRSTPSYGR